LESLPEIRKEAIETWATTFQNRSMAFQFDFVLHGIPLRLHFDNEDLLAELKQFFPRAWNQRTKAPISVYWSMPQEPSRGLEGWDDIADPNCVFLDDFVSQRDFLAKKISARSYQLMANPTLDDGIFNFLRYLLPLELLQLGKILFHSSCVVVNGEDPYLFFGPSGAGKTTMAEFWKDHLGGKILGDDMNILSFKGGSVYVEGAALGQRFFDPKNFGQSFRLKKAYWLTQSQDLRYEDITESQMPYYLSSFANLFWDQLSSANYQKVFKLLGQLKTDLPLRQLFFPKSTEVIPYVQSIHSSLFEEPRLSLANDQWRNNYHRSSRANLF